MNAYEEKLERRRERLEARAARARAESESRYKRAMDMAHVMQGEPVKIGHHSERRHRRDIERMDNHMMRAASAYNEANELDRRAAAVGSGGISSDDPEALDKLREKLEGLERHQKLMVAANRIVRSKPKNEPTEEKAAKLRALFGNHAGQATIENLFVPDFCGRIGFPDYALSNNNANIRRIKGRIAELEASAGRESSEVEHDGLTVVHNTEENRVQLFFNGKPPAEVRTLLKSRGFRWSRYHGAWQRHLNNAGIYAAEEVVRGLKEEA